MDGYREYLDSLDRQADKIDRGMDELKATYARKNELRSTIKWTDPGELDELFRVSAQQKEDMKKEVAKLKDLLEEGRKIVGVEGPDGEPDWVLQREEQVVQEIIEEQAHLEDAEAVRYEHKLQEQAIQEAKKTFAVDSPDGEVDGHILEEKAEINHIIDDQVVLEDQDAIQKAHMAEKAVRKEQARDPERDW